MRDINKLSDSAKIEKAWNNTELQSTQDATKIVIKILDTKYEKADLRTL